MVEEIMKKYFVYPNEAFQIVGKESFGDDWRPDCSVNKKSESRRIALKNLILALQSGRVDAFWFDDNYGTEHKLTRVDAASTFFEINLEKNCIYLSRPVGEPFSCRISADDLRTYIRSEYKIPAKPTVRSEHRCIQWLIEMMSRDGAIPKKAELFDRAKALFPGLSQAAFVRARKAAMQQSGRSELGRAGRPRTVI